MIAFRAHLSSVTKWTSSCASKSGKPQSVVIVVEFSGAVKVNRVFGVPAKSHFAGYSGSPQSTTLWGSEVGRPRGLEPPTPGTTNQCSNQLSYDRHVASRDGSLGRAGHLGFDALEGKQGASRSNHLFSFETATCALPIALGISLGERSFH